MICAIALPCFVISHAMSHPLGKMAPFARATLGVGPLYPSNSDGRRGAAAQLRPDAFNQSHLAHQCSAVLYTNVRHLAPTVGRIEDEELQCKMGRE
jgi:hypothetical protein